MREHTVTVTFERDFLDSEYESVETFVENCLTGNRCRAFAVNVNASVPESEQQEETSE